MEYLLGYILEGGLSLGSNVSGIRFFHTGYWLDGFRRRSDRNGLALLFTDSVFRYPRVFEIH